MRRSIITVYGVAEGARVPGGGPGRQHRRPAPAAGLAAGPAWPGALPRPVPAAGPQPEVPGRQLRTFTVTARLIAGLHPRLTNARRWDFQNAITAHPARRLAPPAVLWEMVDEAAVTVECAAFDASAAAEAVQALIRHAAETDAQIGVREIKIVKISPAGQGPGQYRIRRK